MSSHRAIEFFSGIGAFAEAAGTLGIDIVAAFDQDRVANQVYELNHKAKPRCRNLDTIKSGDIPEADLWWMSPSCKPFTVRGHQKDEKDPRARSFLNLIDCIADHRPDRIFVENVSGFAGSAVHSKLLRQLSICGYQTCQVELCSTAFGVPMRRPRFFVIASRSGSIQGGAKADSAAIPVQEYLEPDPSPQLLVAQSVIDRYGDSFDIVEAEDPNSQVICFTSGYWRCRNSSGSFLRLADNKLRRFSPREILNLLGFNAGFAFPADVDLPTQWRLVGNSVDVRCVRHILQLR